MQRLLQYKMIFGNFYDITMIQIQARSQGILYKLIQI